MSTTTCTDLIPVTVEHEGAPWALWRQSAESKIPLAKDTDVAMWLGFAQPRDIRKLIDRNSDDLGEVSRHRGAKPGSLGGRPEEGYLLTEEQALFIAARSETPKATQVLKAMIAVFLRARDILLGRGAPDPRDALIADLRRQLAARPAPALRPTDIAAAWAKAYLEPAQEPMLVMDVWPRYVEWARDNGQPMPAATQVLAGGLSVHFHRVQRPTPRAAYFCALRATPLPVELPAVQQSLPFEAAPQIDGPDLAERALRVLERHDLPAMHMAEVLGIAPEQAAAVLGPLVEARLASVRVRGRSLFYCRAEESTAVKISEKLRAAVARYVEGKDEISLADVIDAVGQGATRAVQLQTTTVLRELGFERIRYSTSRGWRRGQAN